MKIVDLSIEEAGGLASVFNEQVADAPLCCQVDSKYFTEALRMSREITMPGTCESMHGERILAVEHAGAVVGFAEVAMSHMSDGATNGLIHFLTYHPGSGKAGEAILKECEQYLFGMGATRLWAFHKFSVWRPYHAGIAGLSERMMHVLALFLTNGYATHATEIADVVFERDESDIAQPAGLGDGVETLVERRDNRYCEFEIAVRLVEDGEELGVCECTPVVIGCPEKQRDRTYVIGWIEVDTQRRRKGLGHYLLNRTAWEMHKLGYKRSLVGTNLATPYTLSFYPNCGYRLADVCYHELTKEKDKAEQSL